MKNKNLEIIYIHNQGFCNPAKGGLNTTLLQVFSMCNAFASNGCNVKLFMEGDHSFDEKLKSFLDLSFKGDILFSVSFWRRRFSNNLLQRFYVRPEIKRIIKKENPDIIFIREAAFIKPAVKSGVPVIYESHNFKQHNSFHLIHLYLQHEIIKHSHHPNFYCLFSISHALSDYWARLKVDHSKLFSSHDGFDESLFNQTLDKDEARTLLKLPLTAKIATYCGGLYPNREIETIIRLAACFPEILFLVIGGPETNKEKYESSAKKQKIGNIKFKGFIGHNLIPPYLYASDILLALWSKKVPTINYCSPLKLFEYMASGRLILAHNFPTIKEVLLENEDAVFCEPDDFESLKRKFREALSLVNDTDYGHKARKKAYSKFTWDKRVEKLLQFLNMKNVHD